MAYIAGNRNVGNFLTALKLKPQFHILEEEAVHFM